MAALLRVLVALGCHRRAMLFAYRSNARRLARDAHARIRRFGVSFELNLNDNVQRVFYYTGWYERPFLEFLHRELEPTDTYVDVGAHVGIDAAFVARLVPDGTVFAFEPVPDTVALLQRSVGRLRNVRVIAAALGEAAGRLTLRANPKWDPDDVSTRSRFGAGAPVCQVEMLRFDDWARQLESMDIVKIDVEGGELAVLHGMSESLRRLRPRVVALEIYGPHLAAAGATEHEIVELLEELGYESEQTIGDNAIFRLRGAETSPARVRPKRQGPRLAWSLRPALWSATVAVALAAWVGKAVLLGDYDPIWGALGLRLGIWTLVSLGCALAIWTAFGLGLLALGRRDEARAFASFVPDLIVLIRRLLADASVPRRRKLLLVLLIGYLISPLDPVPDVIPVAGQLDDVIVAALVLRRFLRSGGEPLVRKHWPGPDSSLRLLLRLAAVG